MCGIFTLLNNVSFSNDMVNEQFQKGRGRGPEFSKLTQTMIKCTFGFHRLAINGLNAESNQPFIIDDIALICNGEIYNYKELYEMMGEPSPAKTESDCEVILHLYIRYGIEQTLQMLDGVFSFVLVDYRMTNLDSKIYVARDPYGVRPLYVLDADILTDEQHSHDVFGFASEMKTLAEFYKQLNDAKPNVHMKRQRHTNNPVHIPKYSIHHFEPGTYQEYELKFTVSASWRFIKQTRYHKIGFHTTIELQKDKEEKKDNLDEILSKIRYYLYGAVEKRCITTERPVACLLSGGLDSSLITALVCEFNRKYGKPMPETYSIGLAESEDLKYAQIVADYLGTKHTTIIITEQDFIDAIEPVIVSIESYDTTTVRASIGNWLLGKYISEHSDAKVIFNGDGSDELIGGYLYMKKAPDVIEFDSECRRLLKNIHMFDVLRSDKSISSHGLEPRTPFLDRTWVQYFMSISPKIRFDTTKCEKWLLRTAFTKSYITNSIGEQLLPDKILWRRKEAFSDGVTSNKRSLFQIIQEHCEEQFYKNELPMYQFISKSSDMYERIANIHVDMRTINQHLLPKTAEQFYYRKIFEKSYPGQGHIIPFFWMPKYVDATDASARTLAMYNDDTK
uniref:asparagine synthase (glutamine-hydrolyzing) n=1 Tax=viral metagenome TaxID=1070528 RepID=A0A6C0D2X3_9ZZZZ